MSVAVATAIESEAAAAYTQAPAQHCVAKQQHTRRERHRRIIVRTMPAIRSASGMMASSSGGL